MPDPTEQSNPHKYDRVLLEARLLIRYGRVKGEEGCLKDRRRISCKARNVPEELLAIVDGREAGFMLRPWALNCWFYSVAHEEVGVSDGSSRIARDAFTRENNLNEAISR